MAPLTPRSVYAPSRKPSKIEIIQLLEKIAGGTGAVGEFRRAWNGDDDYVETDLVRSGGSIWRAVRDNTGVTPVEGADWTLFIPGVSVSEGSVDLEMLAPDLANLLFDNSVTPEKFGAVGDGVTDDTDAVQAALDSGAANVVFLGTYLTSGEHVPTAGQRLAGPGMLKLSTSAPVFDFEDKDGVIFDGLQIRGTVAVSSGYSSPASDEPGIHFKESHGVRVVNCKFSRLRYLAVLSEGSNDVIVADNEVFENCFGMRFNGGRRVEFRGNTVRNTCMYSTSPSDDQFNVGLVLESTSGHSFGLVRQAVITGNKIRDLGHAQAILVHGGLDVTISDNTIYGCGQGIACSGFNSTDYLTILTITGNTFNGPTGLTMPVGSGEFGISVQGGGAVPDPESFVISGNVIIAANRNYLDGSNGGIRVGYTQNGVISGNVVVGCGGNGIVLTENEVGVVVTGNVISDVVASTGGVNAFGIYIISAASGIVSDNIFKNITASSGYGIYNGTGNNITADNNKFINCTNSTN